MLHITKQQENHFSYRNSLHQSNILGSWYNIVISCNNFTSYKHVSTEFNENVFNQQVTTQRLKLFLRVYMNSSQTTACAILDILFEMWTQGKKTERHVCGDIKMFNKTVHKMVWHECPHAQTRLRCPTNAASRCAQVSLRLINKPLIITSEHLVINIKAFITYICYQSNYKTKNNKSAKKSWKKCRDPWSE